MKKHLLKTVLLAVGLLLGTTSTWADTTVVGATDNSDAGYYANDHKARYSVANGKKISIEFTVSTATKEQLGTAEWGPWLAWAVNFWDGTLNAITVEARNYGWEATTENTRWTEGWAKSWGINYPEGWDTGTNFRDIIQGATVVATVQRLDADVVITYDITTTKGAKYCQHVVKEYGNGSTIYFDLLVNHAHITIDNEKTQTTDANNVTGKLIGALNHGVGFNASGTQNHSLTLAANKTASFDFINYSSKIGNGDNWLLEIQNGENYLDLRSDFFGWAVGGEYYYRTEDTTSPGYFTLSADDGGYWDNFPWALDGANVNMTIERSNNVLTITAIQKCTTGQTKTQKYTLTHDDFASNDITIRLFANYSHLDLLPYKLNVSANDAAYGTVTAGTAYAGEEVTVTATPKTGYQFVNWTENDVVVSTDAAYTFTALADRTLVANFEAVPTYSYTVNAVDANKNILKQLATGNQPAGEITYAYPRYINVNGTLYLKDKKASDPNYQGRFNLSSADQVENVTYSPSNFKNIVYFSEAEDVLTPNASTNVVNRCSNLQGGTAASATKITTLPAGTYTIYFAMYAAEKRTFSIYKNSTDNVLMSQNGSGTWTEYNTVSFTLDDATDILVQGGDSGYAFDYFFITGSHEVVGAADCSTAYHTTWNTTPLWINAGETAKYKFVNYNAGSGDLFNNWYLFGATEASENIVIFGMNHSNTAKNATYTDKPEFNMADLNGATVELTTKLEAGENNTYTLSTIVNTTKGDGTQMAPWTYKQTNLQASKLKLYVSVERSWLELLSEEKQLDVNQYGWITFASDNALDFEGIEGLTAYAVTGTNGTAIEKKELAAVPAATPLLINGEAKQTYIVPVIANAADLAVDNLMVRGTGAAVEKNDVNPRYILSLNSKNEIAFKLIGATSPVVAANKAYLQLASKATLAPQFINIIGGTTGIDALDSETEAQVAEGAIYNLAGQRVSKDYKGLVIMNGKKVIKK